MRNDCEIMEGNGMIFFSLSYGASGKAGRSIKWARSVLGDFYSGDKNTEDNYGLSNWIF